MEAARLIMSASLHWPTDDPELTALLATMTDQALHALMSDCAEHALEVCAPIHHAAGYLLLPERDPIDVKRRWLAGECTDAELAEAQRGAVWHCYWGNPIALGAAVLGAAWHPGSGLAAWRGAAERWMSVAHASMLRRGAPRTA